MAFAPEHDEVRRQRHAGEQGTDQNVRIDDQSHASLGFRADSLARFCHGLLDQCIECVCGKVGKLGTNLGDRLTQNTPPHSPTTAVLSVAKPRRPSIPFSRPNPDCLVPPKGISTPPDAP
jgi:hypothetical protein